MIAANVSSRLLNLRHSAHSLSAILLILMISTVSSLSRIREAQTWKKRHQNHRLLASPSKHLHSTAFSFPPPVGDSDTISTILTQLVSASVTYFSFITYYDRPRGKLFVPDDALIIQPSQITAAGLGLYTTRPLKMGTILGTYPGVVRPTKNFMNKFKQHPKCGVYAWRFTDNNRLIDPTDQWGNIQNVCLGGSTDWLFSSFWHEVMLKFWCTPTLLARVNEPPPGYDCNVFSREDLETREVVFVLSRDVKEYEELYMDYGLTYDRSSYAPKEEDPS